MDASETLTFYCPQCGKQIEIRYGTDQLRMRQAIDLQLERFGIEFDCSSCASTWVIRKVARDPP